MTSIACSHDHRVGNDFSSVFISFSTQDSKKSLSVQHKPRTGVIQSFSCVTRLRTTRELTSSLLSGRMPRVYPRLWTVVLLNGFLYQGRFLLPFLTLIFCVTWTTLHRSLPSSRFVRKFPHLPFSTVLLSSVRRTLP